MHNERHTVNRFVQSQKRGRRNADLLKTDHRSYAGAVFLSTLAWKCEKLLLASKVDDTLMFFVVCEPALYSIFDAGYIILEVTSSGRARI